MSSEAVRLACFVLVAIVMVINLVWPLTKTAWPLWRKERRLSPTLRLRLVYRLALVLLVCLQVIFSLSRFAPWLAIPAETLRNAAAVSWLLICVVTVVGWRLHPAGGKGL